MRAFEHKDETSAEIIKGVDGYSGDGVGQFTHRAARSKQPPKYMAARPQSLRTLIEKQERGLRELYAEHKAGIADPVRLARVQRDIDSKQNFLARLWLELGVRKS